MMVLIVGKGVLGDATGRALEQRGFAVEYHDPPKGIVHQFTTDLWKTRISIEGGRGIAKDDSTRLTVYPDVVLLCLPTPEGPDGYCGRSEIYKTADWLQDNGYTGLVGIRSTVIMGTRDELARDFPDMEWFSWPEFLQASRAREMAADPPYTVIGWPDGILTQLPEDLDEKAKRVYDIIWHLVDLQRPDHLKERMHHVSPIAAEWIKYATNALLAASVGVANELAELAASYGLDWNSLVPPIAERDAVLPSNVRVIEPGGFGGTCLPKDLAALVYHAHTDKGRRLPVLEAILEENRQRRGITEDQAAILAAGGCGG